MEEITKILLRFRAQSVVRERNSWQGKTDSYTMLECENFFFKCKEIQEVFDAVKNFRPDLDWANIHFKERVSGQPLNPPPSHKMWNKNTDDFLSENGKFSHTYPERFWPKELMPKGIRFDTADLNTLISLLNQDVETRQAFLPIFFNEDLTAGLKNERVPCTLGYYFYKDRFGRLSCDYIIRSVDVIRHLHNDLYLTWLLLDYVRLALETPLRLGNITLIAFNIHCFENDKYTLEKRIRDD